ASFARRGRVEDVVLDAVSRTTAGERG
ncbi:MAG: hypothetical protein QOJ29_2834, partial [Thermoleophilaceae bacterium]|nr:hypothetical protein [Thermoleophilaceae bacterium]